MSDWSDHRREGRLEGACLCGAVRMVVDGGHLACVERCHCSMCRRWAGTAFAAFDVDADAFSWTGEVVRHASSGMAERAFCPACGTQLWFRLTGAADAVYELTPGPFPEAAGFPLVSEIYTDEALASARARGAHRSLTRAEWEAQNEHVQGDDR